MCVVKAKAEVVEAEEKSIMVVMKKREEAAAAKPKPTTAVILPEAGLGLGRHGIYFSSSMCMCVGCCLVGYVCG